MNNSVIEILYEVALEKWYNAMKNGDFHAMTYFEGYSKALETLYYDNLELDFRGNLFYY